MFRLSIVSDVFTLPKPKRSIQLLFAVENLFFFFFFLQPAKGRQKRALNVSRCHIRVGTHKFKSAVPEINIEKTRTYFAA